MIGVVQQPTSTRLSHPAERQTLKSYLTKARVIYLTCALLTVAFIIFMVATGRWTKVIDIISKFIMPVYLFLGALKCHRAKKMIAQEFFNKKELSSAINFSFCLTRIYFYSAFFALPVFWIYYFIVFSETKTTTEIILEGNFGNLFTLLILSPFFYLASKHSNAKRALDVLKVHGGEATGRIQVA